MKEMIDTYSGPTARLIFAIFSLPLGVWSDVNEEGKARQVYLYSTFHTQW